MVTAAGTPVRRGGKAMQVVVVESPAKARTLRKHLGGGYRVLACYGHVRDLPAKAGSVKPDEGFAMVYETAGRRAARALGAIRTALANAHGLVLATDPDREGEAIAWQVLTWLQDKDALGDKAVVRVAFHEITAAGVREAMAHPRALDVDLVRAQQARRALDYLVGYGLSPLMWRKAPGCRSAGRVQSVALRLVCEREAEREAFVAREYWTVEAVVATEAGARFTAGLERLDGAPADGRGLATREMAQAAAARIRAGTLAAVTVERRTVRRRPAPPFTTASLQHEAARRLGFAIGRTMEIAQALYEGVDLGAGERTGLITYMRTDGVVAPKAAVDEARRIARAAFGEGYLARRPRTFRSSAVNVHEAHGAIRPTALARTPESLAGAVGPDEVRLYALIRDRMLASQMAAARFEKVEIALATPGGDVTLAASGARAVFDGFLRVRGARGAEIATPGSPEVATPGSLETASPGSPDVAAPGMPPTLSPGERVRIETVQVAGHLTAAPPRYTEAGLVRRLEALGIGRPSTWAVIVGVLRERGYVAIEDGRFAPLERGRVATAFLEGFFGRWVESASPRQWKRSSTASPAGRRRGRACSAGSGARSAPPSRRPAGSSAPRCSPRSRSAWRATSTAPARSRRGGAARPAPPAVSWSRRAGTARSWAAGAGPSAAIAGRSRAGPARRRRRGRSGSGPIPLPGWR